MRRVILIYVLQNIFINFSGLIKGEAIFAEYEFEE
jgi:hypothetical protein